MQPRRRKKLSTWPFVQPKLIRRGIMSISGISFVNSLYLDNLQGGNRQGRQDFLELTQSLKAGDLAGAQKAFAALQQDMASSPIGQQANDSNQISTDIQALSQSLNANDLTGAQKALAQLQQDMQTLQVGQTGRHHHHHHHHRVDAGQTATSDPTVASANDSTNAQTGNITINVMV
jgi:hypothetical protein